MLFLVLVFCLMLMISSVQGSSAFVRLRKLFLHSFLKSISLDLLVEYAFRIELLSLFSSCSVANKSPAFAGLAVSS